MAVKLLDGARTVNKRSHERLQRGSGVEHDASLVVGLVTPRLIEPEHAHVDVVAVAVEQPAILTGLFVPGASDVGLTFGQCPRGNKEIAERVGQIRRGEFGRLVIAGEASHRPSGAHQFVPELHRLIVTSGRDVDPIERTARARAPRRSGRPRPCRDRRGGRNDPATAVAIVGAGRVWWAWLARRRVATRSMAGRDRRARGTTARHSATTSGRGSVVQASWVRGTRSALVLDELGLADLIQCLLLEGQ